MNKERKIVFNLKGNDRSIVLTDKSNLPIDDLRLSIKEMFSMDAIFEMVSGRDCLIVRSDQISAVMISTDEEFKKTPKKSDDKKEDKQTAKVVDYAQELEIGE